MLIGTDPEYLILSQDGRVKPASDIDRFSSTSRTIGCDGAGGPLEIRPAPTLPHMMEVFCRRLDSHLKEASSYITNMGYDDSYNLWGGSSIADYSIGGHVHFGSNRFIGHSEEAEENRRKFSRLVDVYFLPIINLFLPSHEISERSRGSYGNLGDVRTQPHGIEYRTPYSFAISPFHNRAFFNILSIIAVNHKKLPYYPDLRDNICYYYNEYTNDYLKDTYKKIKPILLKMMKYNSPNPRLNSHTLSLFSLIENHKRFKTTNITKNYGLTSNPKYARIIFSSDDYMIDIEKMISPIKVEKPGKSVYIYGVAKREGETEGRQIFLSDGMPIIDNKWMPKIDVNFHRYGSATNHNYTIGLTHRLRKDIYEGKLSPRFLREYIKNQLPEVL